MSFTDQCMHVITKAHPELTGAFVGATDLLNMHRYGMEVLPLFSKVWYGSIATIIFGTIKSLAVRGAWQRLP
jgi:hypothetical protein